MNRIAWWWVERLSQMLEPDEREAVRGDLAESGESGGQAFRDVLGLVVRRQAADWYNWRPWVVLAGLIIPLGLLFGLIAGRTADGSAVYIWMYANNWDWNLFRIAGFRHDLAYYCAVILLQYATLACWSWTSGFVVGRVSRRGIPVHAVLFGLVLLATGLLGLPRLLAHALDPYPGRDFNTRAAAFGVTFYRVILPLLTQTFLVLLPALGGMRQGRRVARLGPLMWSASLATLAAIAIQTSILWRYLVPYLGYSRQLGIFQLIVYWPMVCLLAMAIGRRRMVRAPALLLALAGIAAAADSATIRAVIQPAAERKSAPQLALPDSSGRTITLEKYRGKVVLLDFWATWCHGCIQEMPWFAEFQRKYARQGLTVVGVSLDEEGWRVVSPFLEKTKVPYQILLGNEATAKKFGIENMPDTYLIDRQGRIAATYVGLVDKDDVETNLRVMLGKK